MNLKGVLYNCFHAYDLGLYQQAFINMADGNWNPYLTIRGLNIFNDHFMPIIFTSIPFVWISNYSPFSMIFLEWFYYITFIIVTFLYVKPRGLGRALFAVFMIVFSKGVMSAIEFPIHPGTWSMFAWFLLVYGINKKNNYYIIICSVLVCLFRESYPFSIFMLSLYYLVKKEVKLGSVLLSFSVIYLLFIFKIRPTFIGPVHDYGGWIVEGILSNPILFTYQKIISIDWMVPLKIFAPFIIPVILIIKSKQRKLDTLFTPCFLMLIPLFAIHIISGKFHFHYGPPFMSVLIAYLCFDDDFWKLIENKKVLYLTIFLFLITSSSRYTKFFRFLVLGKGKNCRVVDAKLDSTKLIKNKMKNISNDKIFLSTGGVIQMILKPGLKVYPPYTLVTLPDKFDYVLFEKNNHGDVYPMTKEEVDLAIKKCHEFSNKVLMNDDYFYFAEGDFPKECVSVK